MARNQKFAAHGKGKQAFIVIEYQRSQTASVLLEQRRQVALRYLR